MAKPSLNILLAGFGGQGLLFAGKLIAYAGLIEGRELSWLPSYGPEMRGGTASCSVCLSDEPIGSPLVLEPDVYGRLPLNALGSLVLRGGLGYVLPIAGALGGGQKIGAQDSGSVGGLRVHAELQF